MKKNIIKLFLKNRFHYEGVLVSENSEYILIKDRKAGIIQISKDSIAVRMQLTKEGDAQ